MNEVSMGYRDTCTSHILVSNIKKRTGHGPLAEWEWPASVKPRRDQQHTYQFSAARILDHPSNSIAVAGEIENFFHVLIYCAVRSLQHNIPDDHIDWFLHSYFEEPSPGITDMGEFAAPFLKRSSMRTGSIRLEHCSIVGSLRFISVKAPNRCRRFNKLISTLLSWLNALHTLDRLDTIIVPDPSQACLGGRVPLPDDDEDPSPGSDSDSDSSDSNSHFYYAENLRALSAKVNDHNEVLELFRRVCSHKRSPRDKKGTDSPRSHAPSPTLI